MNTVQGSHDAIRWHAPGNFHAIYTSNNYCMNLATSIFYAKDAPVHILPPGTVVTITVPA